MDKIFKFLRKRTARERQILTATVGRIANNQLDGLDIKKLAGFKNRYRVRVGRFRIIFDKERAGNLVIRIDEKDDRTYKF